MDFGKPRYDDEVAEQVIVNHHRSFSFPTELKQVYSWIQKGKDLGRHRMAKSRC